MRYNKDGATINSFVGAFVKQLGNLKVYRHILIAKAKMVGLTTKMIRRREI